MKKEPARRSPAAPRAAIARAKKPGRKRTERVLNRETVVAAALEEIDRAGLEDFSLRNVAKSLGVYPTAIAWHAASRRQLLADVVEEAQLKTGRRSEGLLFSASSLVQKAVSGIGIFASGMVLLAIDAVSSIGLHDAHLGGWYRVAALCLLIAVQLMLTMGMLLTIPMILVGVAMMIFAYRRAQPSGNLSAAKG